MEISRVLVVVAVVAASGCSAVRGKPMAISNSTGSRAVEADWLSKFPEPTRSQFRFALELCHKVELTNGPEDNPIWELCLELMKSEENKGAVRILTTRGGAFDRQVEKINALVEAGALPTPQDQTRAVENLLSEQREGARLVREAVESVACDFEETRRRQLKGLTSAEKKNFQFLVGEVERSLRDTRQLAYDAEAFARCREGASGDCVFIASPQPPPKEVCGR